MTNHTLPPSINSNNGARPVLSLSSPAITATNIATIDYIKGNEAISTPYSFEVTFTTYSSLTASSVVGQPIQIAIEPGWGTLVVSGIIFSLLAVDPALNSNYVYTIVVVPRLKQLDLNSRNQVFGTQSPLTVSDLITQLLAGQLDKQSNTPNPLQPNIAYAPRIYSTSYPALDFIVQYGESDLAFLSRRCEAAGVFYFFEQPATFDGSSSETVICADSNMAFVTCDLDGKGSSNLPYGSNLTAHRVFPAQRPGGNGIAGTTNVLAALDQEYAHGCGGCNGIC